jgi:hypothetical protein
VAIRRAPRRHRYTSVERSSLNDDRLSFRARGVLVWLLDKPDDWRTDSTAIARAGKEGREAIRSALRELEEAGYLRRSKTQDEGGRWVTIVDVYETPEEAAEDQGTDARKPVVGSPSTDARPTDARKPVRREPGRSTEDGDQKTENENPSLTLFEGGQDGDAPATPPAGGVPFAEFWSSYPRRVGKGDAEKAWAKAIKLAPGSVILEAARRYAVEVEGREVSKIAHPSTWLNGRRWEDEPGANASSSTDRSTRRTPDREGTSGRIAL